MDSSLRRFVDYIHVMDLAEAHCLALERLQPGSLLAYNLGSGRGYSVREVITACERVSGCTIPVREGPRRPGDPAILVASPEKAMHELQWQTRYSDLETIVSSAWQWHQRDASS